MYRLQLRSSKAYVFGRLGQEQRRDWQRNWKHARSERWRSAFPLVADWQHLAILRNIWCHTSQLRFRTLHSSYSLRLNSFLGLWRERKFRSWELRQLHLAEADHSRRSEHKENYLRNLRRLPQRLHYRRERAIYMGSSRCGPVRSPWKLPLDGPDGQSLHFPQSYAVIEIG